MAFGSASKIFPSTSITLSFLEIFKPPDQYPDIKNSATIQVSKNFLVCLQNF